MNYYFIIFTMDALGLDKVKKTFQTTFLDNLVNAGYFKKLSPEILCSRNGTEARVIAKFPMNESAHIAEKNINVTVMGDFHKVVDGFNVHTQSNGIFSSV